MRCQNQPLLLWLSITVVAMAMAGCRAPKPISNQPETVSLAEPIRVTSLDAEAREALSKVLQTPPTSLPAGQWVSMFDGRTLAGWRETEFAGSGGVTVRDGLLVLGAGDNLTGVNWTNDPPRMNYEISLEAARLEGHDFFCGLTLPVRTNSCSLIVGGWGGDLVGISSLNGNDASENETTLIMPFENAHWYHIRIRVTPTHIETWLEDKRIINVNIEGRMISMRPGAIELAAPMGISSYATTAAIRNVHYRLIH